MYKKTQIKSTSKSHKKYILDDNSINKFKTSSSDLVKDFTT